MLFNSLQFLLFFIAVTLLYFELPHRSRLTMLLLASIYFYMVPNPPYFLVIGGTIVWDYFAGRMIDDATGTKRKFYLGLSLAANIGVLAVFKYYNFLNLNLCYLLGYFGYVNHIPFMDMALPIGLSFHTFQAMSYTIEVYRGNQKAERDFGVFALYVMFYPQMVAGPIERPQNLLPQFHKKHYFDHERLKSGLLLMGQGLFKKVVIADRLALVVNHCYDHLDSQSGFSMLIASVLFSFQIYCDFSGYSDMALGSARVMGFDLMENFRAPYSATSVTEFWRRWHISLSTWFRDYLYFPLGGNRVVAWKRYRNLFIIFLVSGLWHGASWAFVVWGALHGVFVMVEALRKQLFPRLVIPRAIGWFNTFVLVTIAWVFFRAPNFDIANQVFWKIFTWQSGTMSFALQIPEMIFCGVLIAVLLAKDYFVFESPVAKNNLVYYSSLSALVLIIYFFGVFTLNQFIYFQF